MSAQGRLAIRHAGRTMMAFDPDGNLFVRAERRPGASPTRALLFSSFGAILGIHEDGIFTVNEIVDQAEPLPSGVLPAMVFSRNGVTLIEFSHDQAQPSLSVARQRGELIAAAVATVSFGMSCTPYDQGRFPSCAINSSNQFLEVHQSQNNEGLWYWLGKVDGTEISMPRHGPISPDGNDPIEAYNPSVSLSSTGNLVVVMDSGSGDLWYWSGSIEGGDVRWKGNSRYDNGYKPSVAISGQLIVAVHQTDDGNSGLWYWVGRIRPDGSSIDWVGHDAIKFSNWDDPDQGQNPTIALNAEGFVLEAHDSGSGDLWYWLGKIVESGGNNLKIEWLGHGRYDRGVNPAMALGDDGAVLEIHEFENSLWSRTGSLAISQGNWSIRWKDPFLSSPPRYSYNFDVGAHPAIGFNGRVAVQVHSWQRYSWQPYLFKSELRGNASLWFDRSNWMNDYSMADTGRGLLKDLPVSGLVMPATHGAGTYSIADEGLRSQDLSVLSQLMAGCRFFELRVAADEAGQLRIRHHEGGGVRLRAVLSDVRRFISQTPELVILKFLLQESFPREDHPLPGQAQDVWDRFFAEVREWLGDYLFNQPRTGQRLAQTKLRTFIELYKPCLVVCKFPTPLPSGVPEGIWNYRDWDDHDAEKGGITVFDQYANNCDLTEVWNDQRRKFARFNGLCENGKAPCDLFLLSWTRTCSFFWDFMSVVEPKDTPNGCLGAFLEELDQIPTRTDRSGNRLMVNLLYCDYIEYARAADIALVRNGCWPT